MSAHKQNQNQLVGSGEYTIKMHLSGDWYLYKCGRIGIWWYKSQGLVITGQHIPYCYTHLEGKPCTEAQALLILNQIKRELENE